jgi:hypothetical protein
MIMGGLMTFRMLRLLRLQVCVLLIATVAIACNHGVPGRVPVYPARGRVLYKGDPVPGALVVFEPIVAAADGPSSADLSTQLRATGRTGQDGTFQLRTYQGNDGAPAGLYLVGVASVPQKSEGNLFSSDPVAKSKSNPDVLRGRYADPKSSGLKAEIKAQENELPPFDLR